MRHFINIILMEAMSLADAETIFRRNGIDPTQSLELLKKAMRKVAMALHPDRPTGDEEEMKLFNAAWDMIKSNGGGSKHSGGSQSYTRRSGEWDTNRPDNFHDIDFVKHYFAVRAHAHGKKGVRQWTVWAFDGRFQRGMFTVLAAEEDFSEMARVMRIWDRFFETVAVFVQDGRDNYLIDLDGENIVPAIPMPEHDSMNLNPSNDQQWMRRLPAVLEQIKRDRSPEK